MHGQKSPLYCPFPVSGISQNEKKIFEDFFMSAKKVPLLMNKNIFLMNIMLAHFYIILDIFLLFFVCIFFIFNSYPLFYFVLKAHQCLDLTVFFLPLFVVRTYADSLSEKIDCSYTFLFLLYFDGWHWIGKHLLIWFPVAFLVIQTLSSLLFFVAAWPLSEKVPKKEGNRRYDLFEWKWHFEDHAKNK